MPEFFHVMGWPFLACLILVGIHAYLGLHVIERQVIFVDLSLAQIAALGASMALAMGYSPDGTLAYWMSLGFTLLGALIFSFTRFRNDRIPQEAMIGIVYVVSAALMLLVHSRCGEGDEHIRNSMVGNILLVRPVDVMKLFWVYSLVGIFHIVFRKPFLEVTQNHAASTKLGTRARFWDFLFYASFGFVVTSSVQMAGVLLVFAFLIVPSVCAHLFFDQWPIRLIFGWIVGLVACMMGLFASYFWDWPTGSSVIVAFGFILIVLLLAKRILKPTSD